MLAILSDIHANLTALQTVLDDMRAFHPEAVILLGDLVNYGMRPNEVIEIIRNLEIPILANLHGNHEHAILDGDLHRFSTDRGRNILRFTRDNLTDESLEYIKNCMNPDGMAELDIDGKKILCVHGIPEDPFWGKFSLPLTDDPLFSDYDYVLTGHSHVRHYIEKFYPADCPALRNKKRTIFLNPGSVGQPRNQNACAQYALLDIANGSAQLRAVPYVIEAEQALYPSSIDPFYSSRLTFGI